MVAKSGRVIQKDAAKVLGVAPRTLRDWAQLDGFPDCSKGYDLVEVAEWRDTNFRKGSDGDGSPKSVTERLKLEDLRKKKMLNDRIEREDEIALGNILPRDEFRLSVSEIIQVATYRLLTIPKNLCKHVPKKYHRSLQTEGDAEVRKVLAGLSREFDQAENEHKKGGK